MEKIIPSLNKTLREFVVEPGKKFQAGFGYDPLYLVRRKSLTAKEAIFYFVYVEHSKPPPISLHSSASQYDVTLG